MKKIFLVLFIAFSCNQSKDEANIFFLKGNVALKEKNFKKAIEYYNEAIKKESDFADVYNNLGVCYQEIEDSKNAAINFKLAIEKDEEFVEAKLNYANLLLDSDSKTALEMLISIEKKLSDSADYCNTRGQAEFINSDFANASFYLSKAVQKKPSNAEYLTNLGTLQYYQKNFKEAEQSFLKSYSIDSTNAMTINNLGLISMKNKSLKTETYFKKANSLQPENEIILNNYAYFLIKNNSLKQAEDFILKSEKINAQNPYLIRNKGLIAILKNDKIGLDLLISAYQKNAGIENIHSEIGQAYFKFNNKIKACEFWQKGKLLEEKESEEDLKKYCE
jgi:Flp pilus assembly protein TadD